MTTEYDGVPRYPSLGEALLCLDSVQSIAPRQIEGLPDPATVQTQEDPELRQAFDKLARQSEETGKYKDACEVALAGMEVLEELLVMVNHGRKYDIEHPVKPTHLTSLARMIRRELYSALTPQAKARYNSCTEFV